MADNASKAVRRAILNTWDKGRSIFPLVSDMGTVTRGGDSLDIPSNGNSVVNRSENANPAAVPSTTDTLVVQEQFFINNEITQRAQDQLMGGGGQYARNLALSAGGDMINEMDRHMIEYLLQARAFADGVDAHRNLDGGAITDQDVNDIESAMREQDGIANTNDGFFWLASPTAHARIKDVADLISPDMLPRTSADGANLGLPMVGRLNNIPMFLTNSMPGRANNSRLQIPGTNAVLAGGIATVDVPPNHGLVEGMQIFTQDFTNNVLVTAPSQIITSGPLQVTFNSPGADGANGAGTILSKTAMLMLGYAPWIFFATDGVVPRTRLVERSDAAGWSFQIYQNLGRIAHAGGVKVLHAPDGI